MTENPPAIGIDLGTTYSCVAVFQYGKVEIIANDQGSHTTPSYVAFTDRERFIGGAAKDQIAENPLNTVYDIKRLIGRQFNEENVQKDRKQFSYQVVNKNGNPKISVRFKKEEQKFAPEEISAMILGKMKEIAEDFVGCEVREAVITVPAYFDDAQRKATKVAGTIAGLNVLRIINEPTAAAIAYGLEQKSLGDKNGLIFDLGGGTFDVSILTIGDGIFKVNSTAGDTHLGGEDFNTRMVEHFVQIIDEKFEKDIRKDSRAMQKLRTACEQAKLALSSETQTFVQVESLFPGIDFKSQITRAKFESLCRDQFESTLDLVEKALKDANNMNKSDIDEVILVGGSTRIPYIQKILQKYFDGKELNKSINPDEAVAYGAAVQAAILSGDMSSEIEDILLVDVTPLSLGVRTADGTMTNVIDRNSTIPTSGTKIFTTTADNQKSVNIQIFEGERAMTDDNYLLAEFKLTDIPPAGRKVPQIEVTFDIDTDGILNVSAVEKNSGKQNKITIESDRRHLSKLEIDRMVKDSEKFRIADAEQRDKVVAQSSLKEYAYQLQTIANRNDFSTQMSIEEQKIVLNKGEEVFEWLKSNTNASKHDCDQKMKETSEVCSKILNKYKEKLKSDPNNNDRVGTNRTANETSDDNDTNINPVIEELN